MMKTESVEASYYNNYGGELGGLGFKTVSLQSANENGSFGGGEVVSKKKRSKRSRCTSPDVAASFSGDLDSSLRYKPRIGRPPGTGWKQQLSLFGDWMTNSAGMAFAPHAIYVNKGEDVSTKILSFVKKRRALCILSASGSVCEVTLQQSISSKRPITYEGRFDIICLSGSYLPTKTGGHYHHTGGVSVSLSDPVGEVVGGAIGGKLIAATPVLVVAFSFRYDGKPKNKHAATVKSEPSSDVKPSVQAMAAPNQGRTNSSKIVRIRFTHRGKCISSFYSNVHADRPYPLHVHPASTLYLPLQWIDDTRNATKPQFDEVHAILKRVKERLQKWPPADRIINVTVETTQKSSSRSKI